MCEGGVEWKRVREEASLTDTREMASQTLVQSFSQELSIRCTAITHTAAQWNVGCGVGGEGCEM